MGGGGMGGCWVGGWVVDMWENGAWVKHPNTTLAEIGLRVGFRPRSKQDVVG